MDVWFRSLRHSRLRRALPGLILAALISSATWAQERDSRPATDGSARIAQPADAAKTPQPQTTADEKSPGRNVWSTPLAGFASGLGITALLSRIGLNESVAAAVGGVILVVPMIVVIFFAWQFIRRRKVLDPDRIRSRHS